jgi:ZIP family zinc transporter
MMTVLAAATATEELIEGLSIGVGSPIGAGTAVVMGVAIGVITSAKRSVWELWRRMSTQ